MGKKWDYDVPSVEVWKECLRVLKPGGHALIACGTRTQHRMAVNLEDAGFEIRDVVSYIYGSGFPKSLNIEKQLNKFYEKISREQETKYYLRLVSETDIQKTKSANKKQGEVLQSGLSEQNIPSEVQQLSNNDRREESSVEGRNNIQATKRELQRCKICKMSERIFEDGEERWLCCGTPFGYGTDD